MDNWIIKNMGNWQNSYRNSWFLTSYLNQQFTQLPMFQLSRLRGS